MNRREKIVAAVLGTLVFLGLFFFIYTSMKTAPALPMEDAEFEDFGDDFDFNVEEGTAPEVEFQPAARPPASATKKPTKK